jgi:hypothetical protein
MAIIPFAVLWMAYQLGWYGYATIAPWCGVGFADLMLPGSKGKQSRMSWVEDVMSGKASVTSPGCGGVSNKGSNLGPIQPPNTPKCPPGQVWVGDAANGGCVQGTAV